MLKDIKGVIFDYGGTIDTNSRHWAEVLWSKYAEYPIRYPVLFLFLQSYRKYSPKYYGAD